VIKVRDHVALPSTGLSREKMVSFALEVADREGLDAVSVRRLAEHFEVTPMALYHHVTDKAHLIAEMSEVFLAEVEVPPRSRDWAGELRSLLLSYLAARELHPSGPELLQIAPYDSPHATRLSGAMLDILSRGGFDPAEASRVLAQLGAILTARLRVTLRDGTNQWNTIGELGVEMIVLGVQALARRPKAKPSGSRQRRSK
jgi:AcrR family transcriptional regulator